MRKRIILHKVALILATALLRAEKEIFFRTGYKGNFLRGYWVYTGRKIQEELNNQNGTAYTYGSIID